MAIQFTLADCFSGEMVKINHRGKVETVIVGGTEKDKPVLGAGPVDDRGRWHWIWGSDRGDGGPLFARGDDHEVTGFIKETMRGRATRFLRQECRPL